MSPVPAPSRRRTLLLLLIALLVGAVMLSGCARVRAALAVQPDDTVTGEVVLATPSAPDNHGPTVTLPPDLASRVEVSPYQQDDYTGSVLRFSGLRFDQVAALTSAAGPAGRQVAIQMRRAGGRVLVSGRVDLTTVSVDRSDFQLKISFPGDVVETNGEVDSNTVSWSFTAGEVDEFSATVAYADPNAPSPLNWTLGLAGLVALAGLAVVLIARRSRNPPVTPPIR